MPLKPSICYLEYVEDGWVKLTTLWDASRAGTLVGNGVYLPMAITFNGTIRTYSNFINTVIIKTSVVTRPHLAYKCTNNLFTPLKTKCRPLYLKTQSVPRSKHFSSGL